MPKNKSHKGILKRMKITKSGLVRHNKAYGKHLRSSKSAKRLRHLRRISSFRTPKPSGSSACCTAASVAAISR